MERYCERCGRMECAYCKHSVRHHRECRTPDVALSPFVRRAQARQLPGKVVSA